jgi:hypothetical protein
MEKVRAHTVRKITKSRLEKCLAEAETISKETSKIDAAHVRFLAEETAYKLKEIEQLSSIIQDSITDSAELESDVTESMVFADNVRRRMFLLTKSIPPKKVTSADSVPQTVKYVSSAEKLPAPAWSGKRITYCSWKKEFNNWISEHPQSESEILQRLRRALPNNSFWEEQAELCHSVAEIWRLLDVEFDNPTHTTYG